MTPVPPPGLHRVEKLSRLLDEAFRVPGTRIRLGLDSLIGLIPGVGDVAGLLLGGYVVLEAHRLGAPGELKLRMARNVVVDALVGLVPFFGDLYDVAYRSNRRNVQMLLDHYRPAEARPGRRAGRWLPGLLVAAALGGLGAWLLLRG